MKVVEHPLECEQYGDVDKFTGMLRACRTCEIKKECYDARQSSLPIYSQKRCIQVICDREYEVDVWEAFKKIDKYAKKWLGKIPESDVIIEDVEGTGYYQER